jgi:3'(2'), 5'-bisphosphate nucleotidase
MAAARRERRTEAAAARDVAAAAGELLLEIRAGLDRNVSADEVRRVGDKRSNDLIVSMLREQFPQDGILSEELPATVGGHGSDRVWVVDPLDGTREFGEAGRSDWAVHVALVSAGRLTAGAVALPAQARSTLCSEDERRQPAPRARPIRVLASRTRPAREARALAAALDGELLAMGSAGAKIVAVVQGRAEVYVHSGGQHVWDSAAPVAVARASGFHASRLDGSPLDYSLETTWLPDLVVCRPDLREAVLEALGDLRRRGELDGGD